MAFELGDAPTFCLGPHLGYAETSMLRFYFSVSHPPPPQKKERKETGKTVSQETLWVKKANVRNLAQQRFVHTRAYFVQRSMMHAQPIARPSPARARALGAWTPR